MGTGYLTLPTGSAAWVSLPDIAAYDTAADIDLRIDLAPLAVAGTQYWCGRADTWRGYLSGYDISAMRYWDSVAASQTVSKDGWNLQAGDRAHLRNVLDFTAGTWQAFYRKGSAVTDNALDSDSNWTALATVALTLADLQQSAADLIIGANGYKATGLAGDYRRFLFYHGTDSTGTKQADVDFTDLTGAEVGAGSFVEDSANAATVTIGGSGWSYNAGLGSMLLMGVN